MNVLTRQQVFDAISKERDHQIQKWGADKQQSIPGYLLVLRKELEEAELGWLKNHTETRQSVLEEIVQVAATAVACLEKYGVVGNAYSTDDISLAELERQHKEQL